MGGIEGYENGAQERMVGETQYLGCNKRMRGGLLHNNNRGIYETNRTWKGRDYLEGTNVRQEIYKKTGAKEESKNKERHRKRVRFGEGHLENDSTQSFR